MRLVESILTKNPCYAAGRKISVKGLMLHSVGCPQPKAAVFVNGWNRPEHGSSCVHGFIDGNDGTVYQTLPWEHRGWHSGAGAKGSANNTHIGVEMCEPACIRYTAGSNFVCSDVAAARVVAERTYRAAVELFAMLCGRFGLDPMGDGVVVSHAEGCRRGIASNHGDPEHLWRQLGMGYTMDTFRRDVAGMMKTGGAAGDAGGSGSAGASGSGGAASRGTQALALEDLPEADVIKKVGALFTADQRKSGILASVSLAQFILESEYGKSELARNANNCFGMKKVLSGNGWGGSAWDGVSVYAKRTQEFVDGAYVEVTADFRKYVCIEDSVADHSAYLLGAMNGKKKRYEGLEGCADYRKAARIIKDGGYATGPDYVEKLCSIIERWRLTEYDGKGSGGAAGQRYYRVRRSWEDAGSQKGAFAELGNAEKCADQNPGYKVFDADGKQVYPAEAGAGGMTNEECPFLVRVGIPDLNIRMGAGTDFGRVQVCPPGVYTIVEVKSGKGASAWGRLKGGIGWISLDYVKRGN